MPLVDCSIVLYPRISTSPGSVSKTNPAYSDGLPAPLPLDQVQLHPKAVAQLHPELVQRLHLHQPNLAHGTNHGQAGAPGLRSHPSEGGDIVDPRDPQQRPPLSPPALATPQETQKLKDSQMLFLAFAITYGSKAQSWVREDCSISARATAFT